MALFYYWFGLADRYIVFLYNHDMGPRVSDTGPFSAVTSSRYWMAGLVAAGAAMALYITVNWLLGRLSTRYRSPGWWHIWALVAPILLVAIPLITMTTSQPTLPTRHAAQVTVALLMALALALSPGKMAANRPGELIWLAADGLGLMMILLVLPGIEDVSYWLSQGQTGYILMMVIGALGGLFWLLAVTVFRYWRRRPVPTLIELSLAGLAVSYLLVPLLHHLFFTDGYYYITNSANFFAGDLILQTLVWFAAAVTAVIITRLRVRLAGLAFKPGIRDA
jgi:hypothetical protein